MNIPLDRLYHYIQTVAEKIHGDHVIIYRFWPHGSKNIENLTWLHEPPWFTAVTHPAIYCHDQEPLMYDYYRTHTLPSEMKMLGKFLQRIGMDTTSRNLNWAENIFAKNILLHSEQRSKEVEKYAMAGELIPVYYWSHAVIARDWYRFAEHADFAPQSKKSFLIYNRSWSGTREYRLKFADLIIDAGLVDDCQTTFNPVDTGISYKNHDYKSACWRPTHNLEEFFPANTASSNSSADFVAEDYNNTEIEVVLETLFDDSRWHLTEKTLRPIACGQPFILAGPPGSLQYLRSYGFKTFDTLWNEDYDTIIDPMARLSAIVDLMKHLSSLEPTHKKHLLEQARVIADHNRRQFFSQAFFDQVINELSTNLAAAFDVIVGAPSNSEFIARYQTILANAQAVEYLNSINNRKIPRDLEIRQAVELALARSC